jgi:two-component system, LuxR family, response regulator FixJ
MNIEKPTVFVVEDEPETRDSFAALFTSQGQAFEVFPSAEELLQRVSPAHPGCVVTDYRLQGISGIELHRRLVEAKCKLPVILISGYLNVRTATNALRQGIYRVLEKPYQDDELVCAVQDAIKHEHKSLKQKVYRLDFAHRLHSLDARERLTLEMIVAGHGNRAIESRLGLSTRTVDRIRHSILEKMNFQTFLELSAAFGAAQGDGGSILTMPTTGACDMSGVGDSNEGAVECLCAGLLRVQSVLLADDEISEDFRPILRDAEVALSKALGKIGGRKSPAQATAGKAASA